MAWGVLVVSAACGGKPRPFEKLRDRACACKDVGCAEGVERDLNAALEKAPPVHGKDHATISATRHCMYEVWRAAQPPELFTAETEAPREPGPCQSYFEQAAKVLTCERTALADRTHIANDVIRLRTFWNADGTMREPELELYDRCLAVLGVFMDVERCDRPE